MIRIAWLTGILLLASCQTTNVNADVPALITDPDDASRAALQAAVAASFGGLDVLLANDALTTTSVLMIERSPRGSLNNNQAMGRVLEQPMRFQLVKNGADCTLIDLRDDSRHVLADTSCVPEQ
jgi:NAD(P)-dependent dehydrogenase (short-subunit alcohol dehydrogenase family)